jgi:ubiquinone/menaquinone biosynthesis C-methylase UbiE
VDRAGWEDVAEQWLQWSRAPGHDEYWYYRDAFFEVIVPPPGKATLEVGCGEGSVARDLAARGHNVLAVDGSATLLEAARTADPAGRYATADAAALPFADRSIDLAVAYNSLMDIDEFDAAVREVARVLRSGARFCICLTHPILNAGGFAEDAPGAPLVLHHSYLVTRAFDETVERAGKAMRFRGWSRSLETYFAALSGAGFVVERLREPVPGGEVLDARWHRYPMFLHLRAVKD